VYPRPTYFAGWIDTTIHDFLCSMGPSSLGSQYAFITCVDSSPDMASLLTKSKHLKALARRAEIHMGGLLVPTGYLRMREMDTQMFYGFDEIWFCRRRPTSRKPKTISITGPARITGRAMPKIAAWMQENTVSLGLGDGTGMNFCVRVLGLAKGIAEAFTETASLTADEGGD
jgi:hypothetical protein